MSTESFTINLPASIDQKEVKINQNGGRAEAKPERRGRPYPHSPFSHSRSYRLIAIGKMAPFVHRGLPARSGLPASTDHKEDAERSITKNAN